MPEENYVINGNSISYSSSEGITVDYEEIGDYDAQIWFYLRDIYGNEYWTETVTYGD